MSNFISISVLQKAILYSLRDCSGKGTSGLIMPAWQILTCLLCQCVEITKSLGTGTPQKKSGCDDTLCKGRSTDPGAVKCHEEIMMRKTQLELMPFLGVKTDRLLTPSLLSFLLSSLPSFPLPFPSLCFPFPFPFPLLFQQPAKPCTITLHQSLLPELPQLC